MLSPITYGKLEKLPDDQKITAVKGYLEERGCGVDISTLIDFSDLFSEIPEDLEKDFSALIYLTKDRRQYHFYREEARKYKRFVEKIKGNINEEPYKDLLFNCLLSNNENMLDVIEQMGLKKEEFLEKAGNIEEMEKMGIPLTDIIDKILIYNIKISQPEKNYLLNLADKWVECGSSHGLHAYGKLEKLTEPNFELAIRFELKKHIDSAADADLNGKWFRKIRETRKARKIAKSLGINLKWKRLSLSPI